MRSCRARSLRACWRLLSPATMVALEPGLDDRTFVAEGHADWRVWLLFFLRNVLGGDSGFGGDGRDAALNQ